MTLDAYLRENGITEMALAIRVSCSQSTINKMRHGVSNPTADLLRRVAVATDGAVTPNDFGVLRKLNGEVAA